MSELLTIACQAAATAADVLRTNFSADAGVLEDSGKDIKTHADVAAQERILRALRITDIPVLAEEGEQEAIDLNRLLWIVDPLDGTYNFSRGFPMAAVSIALWENGKPLLGVVHDIAGDDVFSGAAGKGAWLNDQEITVSGVELEQQAILATGFPSGRDYGTDSLSDFVQSVRKFKKIRMLGSAALMLAQVAAGRFDVYEETGGYIWDVAAGLALVQAAGGTYRMSPVSGPYQVAVRATNGLL